MVVCNPAYFYVTMVVSTIGTLCSAYYAFLAYQERKNNRLPEEWVEAGRVTHLYAYPLKSSAPIALDQGECLSIGLKKGFLGDRILMIIETKNLCFIKTINYPEIVKIRTSFEGAILMLQHPKMKPIKINLEEVVKMQKILPTTMHTSPITYDCGEDVSRWITKCLNGEGNTLRLAYYAKEQSPTMTKKVKKWFPKLKKNDIGALAAASSYHLINEASINELNSRLKDPITDIHFRPNIVVCGSKAFEEDKWKYLKIGENVFQVIYPCFRCHVLTIDPLTGDRDKNNEPLKTLKTYRLAENPEVRKMTGSAPLMGIYMALRSGPGGTISVNDPVFIAY